MSNDGLSSRVGSHQPGNYETQKLSYFDQGTAESSSPPPNSSTASGSTSTSASLGISDQAQASSSSSSQYSKPSTSIPYDDTDKMSQTPHTETLDVPVSLGEDGKQNPASYQSAIKLLVSNNVAGSIIGRAGQTISDLQTQSSGRIKLSQTGDYFPGTQDRVCLVQGQLSNVKLAVRLLLERLYMLQEQQHSQHLAWQPKKGTNTPSGFDFVVRVLVPSSSCGMIIGKAGANIKHMEESSGVSSIRLSPKECLDQPQHPTAAQAGSGTQERVVTLTGPSKESCIKCLFIVIDGMFANHEISRYTNMTTSYSRHLVPGTYTPVRQPRRSPHTGPPSTGDWSNPGISYGGTFMIKRSTSQPHFPRIPVDRQRKLPPRINNKSFVAGRVNQIGQGEPLLQQFNPPIVDSHQQSFNSQMPSPSLMPNQDRGQRSNAPGAPVYLIGESSSSLDYSSPIQSSSSAPDLLALHFQDNLQLSNSQNMGPPLPVDYNHFAPQMPQPTRPGFTAQVLVPDTLIGSILGRGGRTLNELQLHSNTRIRISQRGEYVPGTRNRIVTIRGQTAQSVSLAQYLMSQRMVLPPTAAFPRPSNAPSIVPSYVQSSPQHHHQQQLSPPHSVQSHQQQPSSRNEPIDSQELNSSTGTQQNPQQSQVLHETFLPNETHPSLSLSSDSGFT